MRVYLYNTASKADSIAELRCGLKQYRTDTAPRYVDTCLAPEENLTEKGIRLWEKERKSI